MYFRFFKLKKWGKKTAETRRRNCAVLPYKLKFSKGAAQLRGQFQSTVIPSQRVRLPGMALYWDDPLSHGVPPRQY